MDVVLPILNWKPVEHPATLDQVGPYVEHVYMVSQTLSAGPINNSPVMVAEDLGCICKTIFYQTSNSWHGPPWNCCDYNGARQGMRGNIRADVCTATEYFYWFGENWSISV